VPTLRPIPEVAADLGLSPADLLPYGHDKAKVKLEVRDRPRHTARPARLVLVSAITPTPAGEGKTTTSIGLGQALKRLGQRVCLALREPSLGPVFGVKGGGTGGGRSLLEPMADINLHFTGDLHAISSAHNLLSAMTDNHLHFRHEPELHPDRIKWPRVMDMNDRSLRKIIIGLQGSKNGVTREDGFDITAASELMAILSLAEDRDDLRARMDRVLVGFDRTGQPVTAKDIGATGSMAVLLRDALLPNLVQSTEGCPALVHGGPFANIAHGCNSVIATKTAMHLADWVVTEAGFGFDLGAEKFFDIKCRQAGLSPDAVVVVATVRALKMHGGVPVKELGAANPGAVAEGMVNLARHLQTAETFGYKAVVAINRFATDTDEELAVIQDWCRANGHKVGLCTHFADGGAGAEDLARLVMEAAEHGPEQFTPMYDDDDAPVVKITKIARKVYGADDVVLTKLAKTGLARAKRLGLTHLPICMAKTQNSLSDDPSKRGRPTGFDITVRDVQLNTGAGFLVALTGEMMRMPGLPRRPAAVGIDLVDGVITGLK
jgi:formate--tetrahydrofolate ligase